MDPQLLFSHVSFQSGRVLSIDVGIKNLAYCLFNVSDHVPHVVSWSVLDLTCPEPEAPAVVCGCIQKNGSPCRSRAIFQSTGAPSVFCAKHAKCQSRFLFPEKAFRPSALKTLKVADMYQLGVSVNAWPADSSAKPKIPTKPVMLAALTLFLDENCLQEIKPAKEGTACAAMDLITLGRNLVTLLDPLSHPFPTHVLIENQISPIAGRMKCIQCMIAQYFILRSPSSVIRFVAASCKLSGGSAPTPANTTAVAPTYKDNKANAVSRAQGMVASNAQLHAWLPLFSGAKAKRDDLADCFLQGVWFLTRDGERGNPGSTVTPLLTVN